MLTAEMEKGRDRETEDENCRVEKKGKSRRKRQDESPEGPDTR